MKIKVKGFLIFRKAMGDRASLVVNLAEHTLRGLLRELSNRFGENFRDLVFEPHTSEVRDHFVILVNGHHYRNLPGNLDSELREGDEVALFPPIAGG